MTGLQAWEDTHRMAETLFDRIFSQQGLLPRDTFHPHVREPLVDIEEKKNAFVTTIEMPGMDADSIEVSTDDRSMEVRAEREKEKTAKKKGMYRQERRYTGFYRYMTLPQGADGSKAAAKYKKGLLTITLPKRKLLKTKKVKVT
ncbi:MAG: Hsp20/alpha crystallin family protein [Candidatus Woesearchaeota archaeon]|nr:Hsp20/alpha crystallin family protein [Candidatus Woesearchaeota archaeon]